MSAEQDRQISERVHTRERVEIVAHVSFRRINQNRAEPDDVIAGNERAGALVVKTEVPARMTRSVERAQLDLRFTAKFQNLFVFDETIDIDLALKRFAGSAMSSNLRACTVLVFQMII